MRWRQGLIWHLLLMGTGVLLLVTLFQVWWDTGAGPAQTRPRPSLELPPAPSLRDSQPLTEFEDIAAKNLFSQDRTSPKAGAAAAKAGAGLEGLRLLGIIIVGDEKAALLSTTGTAPGGAPKVQVIRLGEELAGLKVVEISTETVVLGGKGGEGNKTLTFPIPEEKEKPRRGGAFGR